MAGNHHFDLVRPAQSVHHIQIFLPRDAEGIFHLFMLQGFYKHFRHCDNCCFLLLCFFHPYASS